MTELDDFSPRLELPNIPEGPGVCIIEDENGVVLQVAESGNIRKRIGDLLDNKVGGTAVHGPKIYAAQRNGHRIFVRWKLTPLYMALKKRLVAELKPRWKRGADAA